MHNEKWQQQWSHFSLRYWEGRIGAIMIKGMLGDLLPALGEIEPVEPGCGCYCQTGREARINTGASAAVAGG
ncbi:MAG: hypothetical protein AABO41_18175 [Acidobacteriota bacterium]